MALVQYVCFRCCSVARILSSSIFVRLKEILSSKIFSNLEVKKKKVIQHTFGQGNRIKYIKHECKQEIGCILGGYRISTSMPWLLKQLLYVHFCCHSAVKEAILTECKAWPCKMPQAEIDPAVSFKFKCQSYVWM